MYSAVIRATISRRDAGPCLLLSELLKAEGYDVLVVSSREFTRAVEMIRPHLVIFGTPALAQKVKKLSPYSHTILFDAEGYLRHDDTKGHWWNEHEEQYNALDLGLLWSQIALKNVKKYAPQLNTNKLKVIGNPYLDFSLYTSKSDLQLSEKKSIGFVTRFNSINSYDAKPTIFSLRSEWKLNDIIKQCQEYKALLDSIKLVLEKTDYNISLRPHPCENIKSYYDYVLPQLNSEHRNRINIDESLIFGLWAKNQKLIISPTSTSFLDCYVLGIPVINLDILSNTSQENQERSSACADWQNGCILVEKNEDIIDIIKNLDEEFKKNETLEKHLKEWCDLDDMKSSTTRAVREIKKYTDKQKFKRGFHTPKSLFLLYDKISCMKNKEFVKKHDNFNYRRGFHKVDDDFYEVLSNIKKENILLLPHMK